MIFSYLAEYEMFRIRRVSRSFNAAYFYLHLNSRKHVFYFYHSYRTVKVLSFESLIRNRYVNFRLNSSRKQKRILYSRTSGANIYCKNPLKGYSGYVFKHTLKNLKDIFATSCHFCHQSSDSCEVIFVPSTLSCTACSSPIGHYHYICENCFKKDSSSGYILQVQPGRPRFKRPVIIFLDEQNR